MSIDSLKNRINKRLNMEQYKRDFTDIGSFIKKKRKEMNVTQDEISNGICSISYLSKIENNQIIPNDFYVKEIMEKLNVEEDIYSKSLKDKQYIERTINAFFYMDDDKLRTIYYEVEEIEHNVIINLCKLGYIVYFNLEDEDQYVMMLEHVVTNMTDLEVKVYLYFCALYFVHNQKYKTALELILLNQKISGSNEYLESMFNELSYNVKQRLLVKNSSNEDYYHAMNIYQKYHNLNRVMTLALHRAMYLSKENPKKAMNVLSTIKTASLTKESSDFYYIIKADTLFRTEEYKEATLCLKHIEDTSSHYLHKMILLLRICQIEEDFEMIDSIKEIVMNYSPKKTEMIQKINYHFLVQQDQTERKEYLRDIAIPFSIKIDDYDSLHLYTNEVMEICIDTSRYKEATQYYKKYKKEVEKIKRILY